MSDVTAVLLNYRRPENLYLLIDSLRWQTNVPEIILVNNSPEYHHPLGVERAVQIPWNAGCFARIYFALYAGTEWVMFIDDDLRPKDAQFVEDALAAARQHPNVITGAFGRKLSPTPPHYHGRQDVTEGLVAIVKGRFMFFRRELLGRLCLSRFPLHYLPRCDDIYLSFEIGACCPVHRLEPGLAERLQELPAGDVGLRNLSDHFTQREQFCHEYLNRFEEKDGNSGRN